MSKAEVGMSNTTSGGIQNDEELFQEAHNLLAVEDIDEAEQICRRILERGSSRAKASNLAGCIASKRGAYDEAIDWWKKARRQNPGYVAPVINTAALYMRTLDSPSKALKACDRAILKIGDDKNGHFELLACKAAALLLLHRTRKVLDVVDEMEKLGVGSPDVFVDLGDDAMQEDALDEAEAAYSAALRLEPENAEAIHGMGLLCYLCNDRIGCETYWLRSLEHEASKPPPPWHLPKHEFEAIADEVLLELSQRERTLLGSTTIVVLDVPSSEDVKNGHDPRIGGMLCGVSNEVQGITDPSSSEPRVFKLYQRIVEASCESSEEVFDEIGKILMLELMTKVMSEDERQDTLLRAVAASHGVFIHRPSDE